MFSKCLEWLRASARHGDAYYRAITLLLTSRFRQGSPRKVKSLAKDYRKSLDKSLECLRSTEPAPAVEAKIAAVEQYKSLIADGLSAIEKAAASPQKSTTTD